MYRFVDFFVKESLVIEFLSITVSFCNVLWVEIRASLVAKKVKCVPAMETGI